MSNYPIKQKEKLIAGMSFSFFIDLKEFLGYPKNNQLRIFIS